MRELRSDHCAIWVDYQRVSPVLWYLRRKKGSVRNVCQWVSAPEHAFPPSRPPSRRRTRRTSLVWRKLRRVGEQVTPSGEEKLHRKRSSVKLRRFSRSTAERFRSSLFLLRGNSPYRNLRHEEFSKDRNWSFKPIIESIFVENVLKCQTRNNRIRIYDRIARTITDIHGCFVK